MKQDKIEILLEGLTEDIAELKKTMEGGGNEQLDVIGNLNSQIYKKVQELVDQKAESFDELVTEIQSLKSELQKEKKNPPPLFPENKITEPANHFKSLIWPLPRLGIFLLSLLTVVLITGLVGYFTYLKPLQKESSVYEYKLEWLKRSIPEAYQNTMLYYFENQEQIDQETDSIWIASKEIINQTGLKQSDEYLKLDQ